MSMSDIGIYKCEACGHNIARGRLTCANCGSASPLGVGESICDYDFYLSLAEDASPETLRNLEACIDILHDFATPVAAIYSGNEVVAEVKINDFHRFYDKFCSHSKHYYKKYTVLKEGVVLYVTHHVVDKDTSFDRFVAIESGIITVCEINSDASFYIQAKIDVNRDLNTHDRRSEQLELQISKLENMKLAVESRLKYVNLMEGFLKDEEEKYVVWEKKSWLGKKLSKKPNVDVRRNVFVLALEAYDVAKKDLESKMQYIVNLKKEIAALEETLGLRNK